MVYSAGRRSDFATNLLDGPYEDSKLAVAFRDAMNNGGFHLGDFAPYEPSQVQRDGEVVGVVALQLPIVPINRLMRAHEGLGETGETYLVGKDQLMRSDSRFSEAGTLLKLSSSTVAQGASEQAAALEEISSSTEEVAGDAGW